MSNKSIIQTDSAPEAIGTYSQAVKAGDTVYLSGQIPLDPETMETAGPDIRSQIERVLDNLAAVAAAAGGSLDGVQLLSEETLARATEVQCRRIDGVVPFPMHWRLGFHRAATTRGMPARGFGHYGFGGSGGWACPDRELAVALVLNSGFGTPFGDMRTAEIGGAALRCADRLAAA